MFEFRRYDINRFWFLLVLIQLLMTVIASLAAELPFGSVITLMVIWLFCNYGIINNRHYRDFFSSKSASAKLLSLILALLCAISICVTYMMPKRYLPGYIHKCLLFTFFIYICLVEGRELLTTANLKKPRLLPALLMVLITPLFYNIGYFVNSISMLFVENPLVGSMSQVNENLIGSLIGIALLPAFVEEIIFRGYIYNSFSGVLKIFMSALLFSLLHMNFNQMSYALVLGLLLALIVWYTGNSIYSIIVHVLFNAINAISFYTPLMPAFEKLFKTGVFCPAITGPDGDFDPKAFIIALVINLICLAVMLLVLTFAGKLSREEKEMKEDVEALSFQPNLSFAFGCLICLIVAFLYGR